MRLSVDDALEFAFQAARKAGASAQVATSLAKATVSAEMCGKSHVGFEHLSDYLDGLTQGRIDGCAEPEVRFPADASIQVDARGGIAQTGFDAAFEQLVNRARKHGVCAFAQFNGYTAGELGYYTRRLAEEGLVAIAGTNSHAIMGTVESRTPVYGTNPLSFGAPTRPGAPFILDQACSATAFVNVRQAASVGEPIPEGWALDGSGEPTTNAGDAVEGCLLPFGGWRGANLALMVEILAAGLTGGNWSLDAPSFAVGSESPSVGLFVVALAPTEGFAARLQAHLERLEGYRMRIPGTRSRANEIEISDALAEKLREVRG
ncbi:(2R)-3-sulfolactate dehydrogenase (NADP+) [Paraburkholderia youngii]|uniref:Ldh family oxidoreductase n=1 Tax=Paraburkholderia youngii TaxID=2782701 RepID=UPI003D1ED0AD